MLKSLTEQEIKSFLESNSLYSPAVFSPKTQLTKIDTPQLDLLCTKCKIFRPFNSDSPKPVKYPPITPLLSPGHRHPELEFGLTYCSFTCVTCNECQYKFMINVTKNEATLKIEKVGQYPKFKLQRNKYIEKFSGKDIDYYEKAIACEANGYGIAAFAYFRRILESNIETLLEMINDEATATGQPSTVVDALNELKKDSPMSSKIEIANNALPPHLLINGINPLGKLYKVLSEGVHKTPDEQCLELAHQIKDCLQYLLAELSDRKTNRVSYAARLGKL
ncbi:hypothetical protein [Geothrix sp. SG200]|uniref:hypothetical protein n=1 Tax=Geothrix sp. SG200 TaxID=2922865 RepID=UPI001FACFDBD|nr:hypothetical protein [Geothrix sp. SG200]